MRSLLNLGRRCCDYHVNIVGSIEPFSRATIVFILGMPWLTSLTIERLIMKLQEKVGTGGDKQK